MKQRSAQLAFAIAGMAVIGSVYGWSSTADLLAASGDWSTKEVGFLFATFAIGIGIGVTVSGVLLGRLHYANTIATGLAVWGLSSLLLSQTGFYRDFGRIITFLVLLGGSGIGIAYLALVSFFRSLFKKPTVLSGLIGPLGFAAGSAILCIAQTMDPRIGRIIEVYRSLGIASLALAVVALFFLLEPPSHGTSVEGASAKGVHQNLLSLWALLSLNVAPGMAVIAIAIPWFRNTRSWSFEEAAWAFCAALVALPLGQTMGGLCAKRWGNRKVFFLMFFVRFLLFSAAAFSPQSVWPWFLSAISLACHGSGFGLLPKMVTKSRLGSNPLFLGVVLMGWGLGGAVGAAEMVSTMNNSRAQWGYAALAGLMLTGTLFSTKWLWPPTLYHAYVGSNI